MITRLRAPLTFLAIALLLGHISDATTGQPLGHVTVTLSGAVHRTTTTNASGDYRFGTVAPGDYTLAIHSRDVPPLRKRVTVRAGRTIANITACSTTLDYSCANAGPG